MSDCLFCKIAKKEIPADIIYETEHLCAFRDIDPKAPAHILIIPRKHVETVLDLSGDDSTWWTAVPKAVKEITRKENVDAGGFRLVVNCGKNGGQMVNHIHIHLLGGREMQWPPG